LRTIIEIPKFLGYYEDEERMGEPKGPGENFRPRGGRSISKKTPRERR